MKRIIDGKTYNTETATKIVSFDCWDEDPAYSGQEYGSILYQTRFGAYFLYDYYTTWYAISDISNEELKEKITPLSPLETQKWMEDHRFDILIEQHFGEMPEAGESESRITLRMPDSLKLKIDAMANKNNQSTNAWIVKSLEKAIAYERG